MAKGEVRWKFVVDGSEVQDACDKLLEKTAELGAEMLGLNEIFKTVSESLDEYGKKQDSINSLSMALASQGAYTASASKELQEYAEHVRDTTTYSDSAAMAAETYYARIGVGTETIPKLTAATADLAAVTGMDLADAAHAVGKAIETGSGKALAQYGITVDKSATAQERLTSITQQLEEHMGGSAAAATETYTGHMKQLQNATEEAKESFGFFITQLVNPPGAEQIGWMDRLGKFFRVDMVLALGEFRAEMLDSMADFAQAGARVELSWARVKYAFGGDDSVFKGIRVGKDGQAKSDFEDALRLQASKMRDESAAAAAKGITGTVTPTNQTPHGLLDPNAGKQAEAGAKAMQEALEKIDAAGAKANATLEKTNAYAAAMAEGLGKSYAELVEKQRGVDAATQASLTSLTNEYDKARAAADKNHVSTAGLTSAYEKAQDEIVAAGKATKAANEDAFRPMETRVESLAAKTAFNTWELRAFGEEMKREAKEAGAFSESLGATINQLGGLADELGSAGVGHALGDFGKALGSYGKFQEAFFTGNVVGMVTSGISTVKNLVGAVGGVFKSVFGGKSEAEKIGIDLGGAVSDGLTKAIQDTEKKDNVSRAVAEMLNADAIFKETGSTKPIDDLMNAVKLGSVDAKAGVDELGKAFNDLKTAADGGDAASESAMIQMIQRSRELGESIPALDAAVKGLLTDAVGQLEGFYGGQTGSSAGQGAANNTVFNAIWDGLVGSGGVVEAVESMSKDVTALMKANGGAAGLTGGAAQAVHIAELLKNKDYKGAADSAAAGAKITKDLLDSGYLSQATAGALGTSASSLYSQALKGGGSTMDAEQAILPLLTQLQHAQELGVKLDPSTQALMDQAQKDGLMPMKTVAEQQLDVQRQIAINTGKGVDIPGGGPTILPPGGSAATAAAPAGAGNQYHGPVLLSQDTINAFGEAMRQAILTTQ